MLKFKHIKGQGFGSLIKPFSFVFGNVGLKIIKGKNGAGKTTSISLMSWTLYGKTLKEKSNPETWKHLRPKDWQGTYGEVLFKNDVGKIKVIRCRKWRGDVNGAKGDDGLFLFINGQQQTKFANIKELQKEIDKQLGMSFELFKNSIMFGQKMKRIINESGPIQSKVFEEAFEAEFINEAKVQAEKERDDLQKLYNSEEIILSELRLKFDHKKSEYKSQLKIEKQFEDNRVQQINIIKKEINQNEIRIKDLVIKDDLMDELRELQSIESNIDENLEHIDALTITQSNLKKEISDLEYDLKNIRLHCTKCGHALKPKDIEHTKKVIREQIKSKWEQHVIFTKRIKKESKYTLMDSSHNDNKIEHVKKKINTDSNNRTLKTMYVRQNSERHKMIQAIREVKIDKDLSRKIKKQGRKIRSLLKKSELYLSETKKQLDILIWCVKEPLSNKGIKAYIFENQLRAVNDRLDELSEILPFRIEFGVDTDTKSKKFYTLVEMAGDIVNYEDLSGGEQQLVNIAIAFSIHDVTASKVNALFMDEVFESLDADNIEIVGDLIAEKAKTKEVLLVTHTNFYPTGAEILHYSKDSKGVTKIV